MQSIREKKFRKVIADTLQLAKKIYNYRKDILSKQQCSDLLAAQQQLTVKFEEWLPKKAKPEGLEAALTGLRAQLEKCGGRMYPVTFWGDNAEVLWIAAFLALTIRTFFIQPFRIPTCSMFPSFSGMLTQVQPNDKPKPAFLIKPFRWLFSGAENYYYKAPSDGFIQVPLFSQNEMSKYKSYIRYEVEYGREIGPFWFKHLLSKPYKVYLLWVGHSQIRIRVPFEFTDMEALIRKKFFPKYESFSDVIGSAQLDLHYSHDKGYHINTHVYAKKGECCLHFDMLCGDMVFVDRITYHFRRPKVGEAIVFRTRNIPVLQNDLYYIKRLAGEPGDRLRIVGHQLERNGEKIVGSSAFRNNNLKKGIYPGYVAAGDLAWGKEWRVSDHHFFALGDNSPFSYDSRFWGEVPEKDVLGKAAFVLHPISWRWGFAEHDKANKSAKTYEYVFR